MGAFSLKDAHAIKQALDYFHPDVKDKPNFNDAPDPEIAAINIFLQAVQKAQGHGGEHAYTFDEASLLWEIIEFWVKASGGAGKQNKEKDKEPLKDGKTAKAAVNQIRNGQKPTESSDEDEEAEDTIRLPSRAKKP